MISVEKLKKIRDGMYELGTVNDGDIKTLIIVNMNNGTIVFNNSNCGNGGVWSNIVKLKEVMAEGCKSDNRFKNEKWYRLYKKFIQSVDRKEYNDMIDKMNQGLI